MSTETRVVRPYVGGAEFQQALDVCALQCGGDTLEGGGEVSLSLDDYLNYPIQIDLRNIDVEQLEAGAKAFGLKPSDVDLLILAVAPRLRFVDIVFQQSLSGAAEFPRIVPLTKDDRPRALEAPHGGADIRVYFCLNNQRAQSELKPWRKGTWLGKAEFKIRSDLSGSGFVPVKLTDEDRENFGLPKGCTRYVSLDDIDPFDVEPAADAFKLYVDGELLDRMHLSSSTAAAKFLQKQVFLDATSAVVFAAHKRIADEPSLKQQSIDDFRGSLIYKWTELLSTKALSDEGSSLRQAEFQRLCNNPTQFLAHVEDKTALRGDLLNIFGEDK